MGELTFDSRQKKPVGESNGGGNLSTTKISWREKTSSRGKFLKIDLHPVEKVMAAGERGASGKQSNFPQRKRSPEVKTCSLGTIFTVPGCAFGATNSRPSKGTERGRAIFIF